MRFSNSFRTGYFTFTVAAILWAVFLLPLSAAPRDEGKPKTPSSGEAPSADVAEADTEESEDEKEDADSALAERTAAILESLKQKGLRELGQFQVGNNPQTSITFHLGIMPEAQAIIAQNNFDVSDENFDLDDFTKQLAELLVDSTQYFQKVVPDSGITEFHFVLFDWGAKRKLSTASTKRNSNVIMADIRRWHKLYRGRYSYIAYMSFIHELAHVANYHLDKKETKYHRELTAIVFELLNYYRTEGNQAATENYIRSSTLPLNDDPVEVLSPQYTGYGALRYIGAFLFAKVLDGTYSVEGKPNASLENFARLYLSSQETGDAGFDSACLEAEFKDKNGKSLTIQTIRSDLYAALLPQKNATR